MTFPSIRKLISLMTNFYVLKFTSSIKNTLKAKQDKKLAEL